MQVSEVEESQNVDVGEHIANRTVQCRLWWENALKLTRRSGEDRGFLTSCCCAINSYALLACRALFDRFACCPVADHKLR